MKKKICYALCALLAGAFMAGCSDDGNEAFVVNTVEGDGAEPTIVVKAVEMDGVVADFFNAELPGYSSEDAKRTSGPRSKAFFYDKEQDWYIEESRVHVINSRQELADIYQGDRELPEIDFGSYTLIVGQVRVGYKSYLVEKQLTSDDDGLHLYLHVRNDNEVFECTNSNRYYWALYPKQLQQLVSLVVYGECPKAPEFGGRTEWRVSPDGTLKR